MNDLINELFDSDEANALTNRAARVLESVEEVIRTAELVHDAPEGFKRAEIWWEFSSAIKKYRESIGS